MAAAASTIGPAEDAPSLRRRSGALALTIAIHLLLLLLLIRLAPPLNPPERPSAPTVVSLLPDRGITPTPSQKVAKTKRASGGAKPRAATRVQPPRPRTIPPPPTPAPPLQMMQLSQDDFAAANIAKLPSHASERSSASADASGTGAGHEGGDDAGAGAGPGGAHLYNAQWQREPSHAELAGYLPGNVPPNSWGLIACRTIDHFQVEDCRALAESPSGSGIARALRQAAWQFRVLPPRIGGKAMIGAWVQIRIDFTEHGVEVRRGG